MRRRNPAYLDCFQVADLIGMSVHTVRGWCRNGEIRCTSGVRGEYLIRFSDLKAFMKRYYDEDIEEQEA
jgi:excisionase family DNA binding protein